MSNQINALSLLFCLCALFFSCQYSKPVIEEAHLQLNVHYRPDDGSYREFLTASVTASDADGAKDIKSLTVSHDASALQWTLAAPPVKSGLATVFTASRLQGPRPALPRGLYRLAVEDLAGQTAEIEIGMEQPAFRFETLRFPAAAQEKAVYAGPYRLFWQILHNNRFQRSVPVANGSRLELGPGESGFLYVYNAQINASLISGPYSW